MLWVLASLVILGIVATQLGKQLFFAIRYKKRMEAKTSVIDNENTFVELIAGRLKTIIENQIAANSGSMCGLTASGLKTSFNATDLVFPAPAVIIRLEDTPGVDYALKGLNTSLAGTPTNFQRELKDVIQACPTVTVPQNSTQVGVFKFCVGLDTSGEAYKKIKSTSFLFSEHAIAEIRVELMHQGLTQDQKTFQTPPNCSAWSTATASKQLKVIYRIYWKAYQDSQGYFSWMGNKMLNLNELRTF